MNIATHSEHWIVYAVDVSGQAHLFASALEMAETFGVNARTVDRYLTGHFEGRGHMSEIDITPDNYDAVSDFLLDNFLSHYKVFSVQKRFKGWEDNVRALQEYRNKAWKEGILPKKPPTRRGPTVTSTFAVTHTKWQIRCGLADGRSGTYNLTSLARALHVTTTSVRNFFTGRYGIGYVEMPVTPESLGRHRFLLDGLVSHYEVVAMPYDTEEETRERILALQECRNGRKRFGNG